MNRASLGHELGIDDLYVGREFGPYRYHVSASDITRFLEATGTAGPPRLRPDERRPAPGMLVAVYASVVEILRPFVLPPGLIHARQRFTFHAAVRAGDSLSTGLVVADRFEHNALPYVVLETATRNAEGTLVCSGSSRIAWAA